MDEKQLGELREWGRRVQRDGRSPQLRAAGRALDLATAEIERLRSELDARTRRESPLPPPQRRRRRKPFDVEGEATEEADLDDDEIEAPEGAEDDDDEPEEDDDE